MPIYEYRCSSCGHEFETIQKVGARPLRKCPECTGSLKKLVSRTAFQLKGGGWFAQDYGGKAGKAGKPDSGSPKPAKDKKEPKASSGSTSDA